MIAISRLQAARLKLNRIWTTGGYSGIAQTVLVAMPTVCPPLQIYAAAELAGAIFSLSVVSHDEIHCPSNDTPIPWLSHLLISCLHLGMPQEEVPLAQ
jgi:hypothetical protein